MANELVPATRSWESRFGKIENDKRRRFVDGDIRQQTIGCRATAQEETKRFRESDNPKSISELKPDAVPDEENAARWIAKSNEGRLAIDIALAESYEWGQECDKAFLDKYNQILAKHPDTYELLFKASDAKHHVPDIDFGATSLADFKGQELSDNMRSIARVLMYRMSVEIQKGSTNEAAKAAIAILELESKENLFFGVQGFLTRAAVRGMGIASLNTVLQSGKPISAETIAAAKTQLEKADSLIYFQSGISTERVIGIQLMKDQGAATFAFKLEGYLQLMRVAEENSLKTIAKQKQLISSEDDVVVGPLTGMLLPALNSARNAAHRNVTKVRCLRILLELKSKTEEEQQAPNMETIDLPESAKTDPVSGNPLIIKKEEGGWLIYGVGINGVDDGGQVDIVQDYGIGPGSN